MKLVPVLQGTGTYQEKSMSMSLWQHWQGAFVCAFIMFGSGLAAIPGEVEEHQGWSGIA